MVEAMTEIQGRADSMMEEIKAREASVNISTDICTIIEGSKQEVPKYGLLPSEVEGVEHTLYLSFFLHG